MKGWGSSVGVYVSADGAARDARRKLLAAIEKNACLELEYLGPGVPEAVADHFLKGEARRGGAGRPPRVENRRGFRTLVAPAAFRALWASLPEEDKMAGAVAGHLTPEQVDSVVALEVNIAIAEDFRAPRRDMLRDELLAVLSGGGRFRTGRLPDGFEDVRPPKALVGLFRTRKGEWGLITRYRDFDVVELNGRVGVVAPAGADGPREEGRRTPAVPRAGWSAGLFAGAFMFDSAAAFRKYLLAAEAVAAGDLLRWDAGQGGAVRVEAALRGELPKEVAFAYAGGLPDAKPGDRVVVVLRKDGGRFVLHAACGASGLYKDSRELRAAIADALGAAAPPKSGRPAFEEVILRAGEPPRPSQLFVVLTVPGADNSRLNDLVVRHAAAALAEAKRRRFRGADAEEKHARYSGSVVFVVRERPGDRAGHATGFSPEQLREIAGATPERGQALAGEHAWSVRALPEREEAGADAGAGAAGPRQAKWEYARLQWESDTSPPARQLVTWEGPGVDPVQADSFQALARKLKLAAARDSSTALLNALGTEGWELVSLNYKPGGTPGSIREMDWTFKRRK